MAWHHRFRNILLVYVALFLALTFPYWLQGEVAAPYRQSVEIGVAEIPDSTHLQNKKFSDFFYVYTPEIRAQLQGQKSGWLPTWTALNELGRPVNQISGFSLAYLPSWLLSKFTNSPDRFLTVLSLSACFFAGLFMLLLCRELELSALAGLIAAGSLAAAPVMMYWLTFPMFVSVFCWSAAALYALTRLEKKYDLLGWGVLAFSLYSMLMTSYQQLVVFHLYLLVAYAAFLLYRQWMSAGKNAAFRYTLIILSAAITGGLLALPVYLDLVAMAAESARAAPDSSFFTGFLPTIDSGFTLLRSIVFSTLPELFGYPVSQDYHFYYNGLSATPLIIFMALFALASCLRKTLGWWLAVAIIYLLAFIHPLYLLGVKYLLFNLSPINPIFCIALPMTIIVAYGTDALINRVHTAQHLRAIAIAAIGSILLLLLAIGFALNYHLEMRWEIVVIVALITGFLTAQYDRARPLLLLAALLLVAGGIAYPLQLHQQADRVTPPSALLEAVKTNLPPDSRYAVAEPGVPVFRPNLNATLGLPSLHSYNSLSPKRYHVLIRSLGGETMDYGRWNGRISPDYGSAMFWMSNIGLMLAPVKLEHANLEHLGELAGIHLHRVISRMGCCLQLTIATNEVVSGGVQIDDPRTRTTFQTSKTLDQGDMQTLEVNDGPSSLLILSQKFHSDWHARALTDKGWVDVQTLPVNGVFQGAVLPEHTRKVQLQFLPWVRYSWIAHVFWALLGAALLFQLLRTRLPSQLNLNGRLRK